MHWKCPSPFGVRVLKSFCQHFFITPLKIVSVPFRGSCSEIEKIEKGTAEKLIEFPSPFGVRVLKLEYFQVKTTRKLLRFPSPFGVRVLKFLRHAKHLHGKNICFRPLSGFVF